MSVDTLIYNPAFIIINDGAVIYFLRFAALSVYISAFGANVSNAPAPIVVGAYIVDSSVLVSVLLISLLDILLCSARPATVGGCAG